MKYVIISDLHSNLEALVGFQESLEDLKTRTGFHYDKLVCLGDIVGYGASPNEVIDWVRDHCQVVLAGNHDYAVIGKTDTSYFNQYARDACQWTAGVLTQENQGFLAGLSPLDRQDAICWVHSSPFEPEDWHYIENRYDGADNFPHFSERVCFVGHSHRPLILEESEPGKVEAFYEAYWKLKDGHRYIFNVGSLGQPRDGNPDPPYAIFDSDENTFQLNRFCYDIEMAQAKMKKESLPEILAGRLSLGK